MKTNITILMCIIFALAMIAAAADSINNVLIVTSQSPSVLPNIPQSPPILQKGTVSILDTKYAGYGKLIDTQNPLESNMLKYRQTIINGSAMAINDTGTIFYGFGRNLYKTSDGGKTSTLLYVFPDIIMSIYYYSHAKILFVGSNDSNIYRSTDNGKTWNSVLKMSPGYPLWWSWDSDSSKILVGRYGNNPKTNDAVVYKSIDKGQTWTVFFKVSNYNSVTDNGAHTHLVKIDPYNNNRVFVTVGDNAYYRGLYITENNGVSFDQTPVVQFGNYAFPANGFLGAVFPDKNKVIFFTDSTPTVWEYNKNTKETKKLAEFPDPYFKREVKFYDAILGKYGVIYAAAIDYISSDKTNFICISIDGKTWYRLNSNFQNLEYGNIPLKYNPKDGYIYAGTASNVQGIAFKDLTIDEAAKLLNSPTTEAKNIVNYVPNPSFETGNPPTGWNIGDVHSKLSQDCSTSRYGKCSVKISESTWNSYQNINENTNFNLSGNKTYVVRFSYKLNMYVNGLGPLLDVVYDSKSGSNFETIFMGNQYANNWSDVVYYWIPSEDINVKRIYLFMYDKSPTYLFDGISISNAT